MPRVVVVFATVVLLCSRVAAQIGPLGHSEWGGLVPTTAYTTLQQWNNAFNEYNVACGASNCSSSVAAQKVAEGWSTSTIPVNATQMEINNWMRPRLTLVPFLPTARLLPFEPAGSIYDPFGNSS